MIRTALLAGVASIMVASAASAATVSYSDSYGSLSFGGVDESRTDFASKSFGFPYADTPSAPALNLAKFDTSLGTLTGVMITLEFGFKSKGSMLNFSQSAQQATYENKITMIAESDAFLGQPTATASQKTNPTVYQPGVQNNLPELSGAASVMASPTNLGFFTSGDSFTIDYATGTMSMVEGGGGNLFARVETVGAVKATVKYTYDEKTNVQPNPVPVPPAIASLALALGSLLLLNRRRA